MFEHGDVINDDFLTLSTGMVMYPPYVCMWNLVIIYLIIPELSWKMCQFRLNMNLPPRCNVIGDVINDIYFS